MNPINKFTRFLFTLLLVLGVLGFSTSTALADKPTKNETYTWTLNSVINNCEFPVNVSSTMTATETYFFDQNGILTKINAHVVGQETFSANQNTLVGIPYTFHAEMFFDSSGNPTHFFTAGVVEKIWLPDGHLFISAGQLDFTDEGISFILTPDKGHSGNVEEFCAALAP